MSTSNMLNYNHTYGVLKCKLISFTIKGVNGDKITSKCTSIVIEVIKKFVFTEIANLEQGTLWN